MSGDAKPDVVVLPREVMIGFEKSGAFRPGSLIDLARVGIGVAVKEGAPLPDISTVDALKQTLLNAKSIAHPDPKGGGFTGAHIDRMFERLGIADAVRPKVKLGYAFTGGVASIAKGDAEIGIFNISEIVPIKGVRLVGPLPAEYQNYLVFAGALHVRGEHLGAGCGYLARSLHGAVVPGRLEGGRNPSIGPSSARELGRPYEQANGRSSSCIASVSAAAALLVCALVPMIEANAADIKILSPGATEGVLNELLPQFEQGVGPPRDDHLRARRQYRQPRAQGRGGRRPDLVGGGNRPAAQGRASPRRQPNVVAKTGIGIFVRKGDPKPDISTADAFLRTLATAKVIAYADPKLGGSASIVVADILRSLDVTGSIGDRTRLVPPAKPLIDLVAGGGVDFGFQPIPQIFLDPRIEYVGPLPAPYQQYTNYVASLVGTSKQPEAYKALLTFLDTPAAAKVFRSQGFEPS